MNEIDKIVSNGIMAIIPLYVDMRGNSTKAVTFNSDDCYLYKSIRSVLILLAKYFMIDLNVSRRYYGRVIGCANVVPIPFNKDNIFVPIKVRKPLSKNDGSFGYINLGNIKRIDQKGKYVQIILDNEATVDSIQSYSSIHKHIKDAKLVKQMYYERLSPVVAEDSGDFYKEYNKPATKGDIAILKNELMDIKSKLCGVKN